MSGERTTSAADATADRVACPNAGPDEYGEHPCDPEPNGDGTATCSACGYTASLIEGDNPLARPEHRALAALARLLAAVDPYGLDMEYTPWEAHNEFDAAVGDAKQVLADSLDSREFGEEA